MSHVIHYKGNREPNLADTFKKDGVAVDLTGASSLKFKMRLGTSSTTKVDAAAVIVAAATGSVRYDWAAADVDTAGFYVGWWEATFAGPETRDSDEFALELREHGPSAGHLCTLDQIRDHLQKKSTDRGQDTIMLQLVGAASIAIQADIEREIAPPVADATRRFPVDLDDLVVDLAPYDLRTVSSLTLHPEATTPTVLTSSDYVREPIVSEHGTYQQLRLSNQLSLYSTHASRFGYAQLDCRGAWGFASIPADVEHWCKVQVWLWMRKEIQAWVTNYNLEEERLERPEALATVVRRGLDRYRRMAV